MKDGGMRGHCRVADDMLHHRIQRVTRPPQQKHASRLRSSRESVAKIGQICSTRSALRHCFSFEKVIIARRLPAFCLDDESESRQPAFNGMPVRKHPTHLRLAAMQPLDSLVQHFDL